MAMVQPADVAVKANEILARLRPIAPKPPAALMTTSPAQTIGGAAASRVLSQLQSRPCRARKRGRPPVSPLAARRKRPAAPYPAPQLRCAAATDGAVVSTATRARVSVDGMLEDDRDVPVERDLLRKLLEPKVISPRAVRPVSSTIHVLEPIVVPGAGTDNIHVGNVASKTAEEVEAELEAEALPAVVADSSSRVRLVNDAYKEMRARGSASEMAAALAESQNGGFSCAAKIEWERGGERASVNAACDVIRLQCESRDYIFAWSFRTADASSSVSHHRAV
ncbi:hypothetical protein BRADI_1g23171v3 [Brachypodium distachyon]|uniref:DUF7950 domain-containing protein n=1 Tax=Brachypodium distachyon TaxID=15368 RepID=A0A0Q3NE28_BRADI|nr:hypothetical protein BRADI_1g23171v3 [Brachypodium distachyon]